MLEKLMMIQAELKCNKGQFNKFGGYAYRSCEDILEAVKPILAAHKTVLTITDEIVLIGDRYYIKATAQLLDCESDKSITTTAYAREPADKKGSDASQITGAASSYARKYALNGLFCIDDTKDADTNEYRSAANNAPSKPTAAPERIMCTVCGQEIKPAQNGAQKLSAAQIAHMTGGKCIACHKKANQA